MSSTIKISDSLAWATCYFGFKPLNIGANNEPALTCANIVLQSVIGPPFAWSWNRDSSTKFLTVIGQQDYEEADSTFGFIEKASYIPAASITNVSLTSNVATYTAANSFSAGDKTTVTGLTTTALNITYQPIVSASATDFTVAVTHADISSTADTGIAIAGDKFENSQVLEVLGDGSETGPPTFIAPQEEDDAGNITFRVLPVPDKVYQIRIIQQKETPLISALSQTWRPVPDGYSYIMNWGFLALLAAYANDPRWQIFNQKFVGSLLGVAEGLDEQAKNIFQNAWLNSVTEQQVAGIKTQQGRGALGT